MREIWIIYFVLILTKKNEVKNAHSYMKKIREKGNSVNI